jgi:hypothetical protein
MNEAYPLDPLIKNRALGVDLDIDKPAFLGAGFVRLNYWKRYSSPFTLSIFKVARLIMR